MCDSSMLLWSCSLDDRAVYVCDYSVSYSGLVVDDFITG